MAETVEELKAKIALYEKDGAANLFYALNRKLNEMAGMLNKQSLTSMDLTDAKDKSFERMKTIWSDAASIATAVKALGETAGITNDESKDTQQAKYRLTPENISDVLSDSTR